jgi:ABC-type transport system involved in cytochrome c biogenesis permease subunit
METYSAITWTAIVMFLGFSHKVPRLKSIGFVVLPCTLLMLILGLLSGPSVAKVPATFQGAWFIIHIASGIVVVGAILITLSTSIFYLLKQKKDENEFYRKLPSLEVLDTYSYKYAGFGFIFWTIMVASGALWANQSWGRYWGWDPIEAWSLVTWLLFGIYLHLRRFFKWQGEKAAWFMVICALFSVLTMFVIPFVMKTVHSEYLL